jgi:O-antigen/teichoic acid export membrane protein
MNRLASNAFWNIVNLGSGALVAVAVPPFLTRLLPPQTFGAWALALQLASYVGFFGFGVQTVVARHVSIANQRGSLSARNTIVATAFWLLTIAALSATAVLLVVASAMEWLFPELPPAMRSLVASVLVGAGISLALALPTTAFLGVFAGVQRVVVPALAQVTTRMLLAIAVVAVAGRSADVRGMAAVYFCVTLAGAVAIAVLWRFLSHAPTVAPSHVARSTLVSLVRECAPLTLWNLAMLLVTSFSLFIVSRIDPEMIPYFAVAATLTALLSGVLQAGNAALLPIAAAVDASGDTRRLSELTVSATRVNGAIGLLLAAPLIYSGQLLLSLWVGIEYAVRASLILAVLGLATLVRLSAFPYATAAIAAGQQHRMLWTPMIEACATISAGVLLGRNFGALGVALGALAGSGVGVAAMLIQHPLRRSMAGVRAWSYLRASILRMVPVVALLLLAVIALPAGLRNTPAGLTSAVLCVGVLCWFLVLTARDRAGLMRYAVRQGHWERTGE